MRASQIKAASRVLEELQVGDEQDIDIREAYIGTLILGIKPTRVDGMDETTVRRSTLTYFITKSGEVTKR